MNRDTQNIMFASCTIDTGNIAFPPRDTPTFSRQLTGPLIYPRYLQQTELHVVGCDTNSMIADSLNTTTAKIDEYFPTSSQNFYGPKYAGCLDIPKSSRFHLRKRNTSSPSFSSCPYVLGGLKSVYVACVG